jgi:transcription elongation factor SPT5
MSKMLFRPPPALPEDSDDDDASDEELLDDDDEKEVPVHRNANLSESSSDDDDVPKKRPAKGMMLQSSSNKRAKTSSFFDEEAEASDDDDEDNDDYKKGQGEDMDEQVRELIRQQDRRRAASGGGVLHRSTAEIARDIEQRHRLQNRRGTNARVVLEHSGRKQSGGNNIGSMGAGAADDQSAMGNTLNGPNEVYAAVAQQSLVPSVSDPSFWMVSCASGKEQELVLQLLNKCAAFARQGRPLGISAAIAAQTKGKVYIESFSEPAVMEAIQGVRGLLQYTMRLVPIQDMTTVMTVATKKKPVKKNEWVRMTRGHYKGDLALVKSVKESGLKCVVQCVPRLDLTLADLSPEEAKVRRRTVRPPQKFFNPQEVAALGRQSLRRQRFPGLDIYCDYFEMNYYNDGYLLKEMAVGTMIKPVGDDDPPSLEELQSFQKRKSKQDDGFDDGGQENEGSLIAASLLDELSELQGNTGFGKSARGGAGLLIGDTVEIIEGDLIGMRGKVVVLDGTSVKIKPINADVDLGGTEEVEFLVNQVRKYIPVGAHVKVTEGRYANETGVVVAVDELEGESDCTAVVLTDVTNKEISVRTSQLRESAEVASGQDKLQGYELYDLVVLSGGGSANEVGVIVRVGREDFTVINNHGIVREVRPEELRGKRNSTSGRAVALDVQGNQIRVGDTVNVAEGPHKGKSATIKRMSRAQLFLHSQTRSEHAGVFVVRSRSCVLAGSRQQNRSSTVDTGASPFATPQSQSHGGPPTRNKRDDGLIGKTVRIQAGQWKGYLGTVADSTPTHLQVELHSRLKKVMVVRERVSVVGDKFGATEAQEPDVAAAAMAAPLTMATPMHVSIGGATPAIHGFGGATPAHGESENSDEVWRPGGTVDQEAVKDDGWGNDDHSVFGSSNDNTDSDWRAPTVGKSTWGAPPPKKEEQEPKHEPEPVVVKQQPKSEMETEVADTDDTPAWFMERVCVQLKVGDKVAVIKEINADKTALIESEDKTTRTVRVSDISMISPKEHDMVLVTGGNEIGLEGSLVCVDGSDAILKDANDEFKIIDFVHLVKISSD